MNVLCISGSFFLVNSVSSSEFKGAVWYFGNFLTGSQKRRVMALLYQSIKYKARANSSFFVQIKENKQC